MDIQSNISNNIKKFRREQGISQEALAERMGVTSQAVSKWECMQSIPDIEALVALSDLLGVSLDKLILDKDPVVAREKEGAQEKSAYYFDPLPDDGALRVLQFKGKMLLREDTYDPEIFIPLAIEDGEKITVHVVGSAHLDGNVGGNLHATNATCGMVAGNVQGVNVTCNDVAGDVSGTNVDCDVVAGDISTVNATCNDVVVIKNCVSVTCDSVVTVEHCERDITCDSVDTIVRCDGNITCDDVETIQSCKGNITCDDVETIEGCEGSVICDEAEIIRNCSGDIHCTEVNGRIENCGGTVYVG